MTTTLPVPSDDKLTHWDGQLYVKTPSGAIPYDYWRIAQWLHTLATDDIRRIVRKVCSPLPLPIGLQTYGEPDNREGLITYLRCTTWRWYEIGMTVERIESGEFTIPSR